MKPLLVALGSGFVFALGLGVSGMTSQAKVLGFLDVTGAWDPSLMFVLGGAVAVSALGYRLSRRLPRPVLADAFQIPTNRRIDAALVGGSAVFGIGWGLSGFCPGPAVAALSTGRLPVAVFVAAMLVGMAAHRFATAPGSRAAAGPTR
ncbi:MAG: YeeE/YedE family protein [Methylobacterium sp.]|nr:MAG: YeeE/YedE family protein [Methylobacterium sp.]